MQQSVPDEQGAYNAWFDQPREFMLPSIVPAQVLTALSALAVRPGMAREPGKFKRRNSTLPTAARFRESDNLETRTFGIGKRELVFAVEAKAVTLVRHAVQAPGAKPITSSATGGGKSPSLQLGFGECRRYCFFLRRTVPVHCRTLAHQLLGGQIGLRDAALARGKAERASSPQARRLASENYFHEPESSSSSFSSSSSKSGQNGRGGGRERGRGGEKVACHVPTRFFFLFSAARQRPNSREQFQKLTASRQHVCFKIAPPKTKRNIGGLVPQAINRPPLYGVSADGR